MPLVKYNEAYKIDLANKLYQYIEKNTFPVIYKFAATNKIPHTSLLEFELQDERRLLKDEKFNRHTFSELLKIARDKQTSYLITKGLHRKVNTAMAIFCLKNIAGWRDVQEIESTTKNLNVNVDLNDKNVDNVAQRLTDLLKKSRK